MPRLRRVGSLLSLDLPKTRAGHEGPANEKMVGAHGLGPWTSSLSETRSNQLSYAPGERRPPGDGTAQCGVPGLAPPSGGPAPS